MGTALVGSYPRKHSLSNVRSPRITERETHKIITAPEDVTPKWLTDVFQRNGIDARVQEVEVILSKRLPISTVSRLKITYDGATDDAAPRTLFLKLPHGTDHAEIKFYQTVAPKMSCPPLVRCYDAASSEPTADRRTEGAKDIGQMRRVGTGSQALSRTVQATGSHILLDDLTDTHTQPRQKRAPSLEMSRRAVKALARAHAANWNKPVGTVFDDRWLRSFIEDLNKSVNEFVKVSELADKQRHAYRLMLDAAPQIWGRLTDPNNLTVTHGDVHWWNFLYPRDANKHAVHVIDWHLWHIDLAARDLAFFLALGGFAEPRPDVEPDLLRAYHDTLGVPEYSFDMLFEDYRRSAIRNLNIPVIYWSQGKHKSTVDDALRRAWEAFERLDCREFL